MAIALIIILPLFAALTGEAQSVAILASTQEKLNGAIQTVADVDGEIIAISAGHILFARSDRPGFASRLRAAGAWLIIPALNVGCSGSAPSTNPQIVPSLVKR